jgi:hypothetical protein
MGMNMKTRNKKYKRMNRLKQQHVQALSLAEMQEITDRLAALPAEQRNAKLREILNGRSSKG